MILETPPDYDEESGMTEDDLGGDDDDDYADQTDDDVPAGDAENQVEE